MPEPPTAASAGPDDIGPRIDKWLWHARFFKTRTLAGKLCNGGKLRVNSAPIAKAHYRVRRGDVLTFPQGGRIRVVEVRDYGGRRGPPADPQTLNEQRAPPAPRPAATETERNGAPAAPHREAGAGRPTKADRRAIERLRGRP
ncbi:MAG: RNA-binding S4 domain-containing protein [Rhodospirillaceae bacterium]|nr:RNA-binding S4 domain-containing protein [Rhodospirillaceae bacterium]